MGRARGRCCGQRGRVLTPSNAGFRAKTALRYHVGIASVSRRWMGRFCPPGGRERGRTLREVIATLSNVRVDVGQQVPRRRGTTARTTFPDRAFSQGVHMFK